MRKRHRRGQATLAAALVAVVGAVAAECHRGERAAGTGGKGSGSSAVAPVAPAGSEAGAHGLTITVIGTSDLHGHIEALPLFAGYVSALRAERARDGGAVLLVDAGDLFQGTLESNLGEGDAVIRGYDRLQYDAAAIGNHEFDFGPVGPDATPKTEADDAQGALKARAAEAKFPVLTANVLDAKTGKPVAWANVSPHVVVTKAGVKIGLVGVTSEDTPHTTIAINFRGLKIAPLAATITTEAAALRKEGATVVIVLAHAGGKCHDLKHADDVSSCDSREEIMKVAAALPAGTVDAIVAGHTHQGMAQVVSGIPVIESFSGGKAFGRIDLTVDPASGHVTAAHIFPPHDLKGPETYDGARVEPDAGMTKELAPFVERARAKKEEKLGVVVDAKIDRSFDEESAEGNWFADLMLAARPGADVAMTNGGGLRADIPAGDMTYGALFEAMPFDNRFATVVLTGRQLRRIVRDNLGAPGGILSLAGVHVVAECGHGLKVRLYRDNGTEVGDTDHLVLVTSDFLATGGDVAKLPEGSVTLEDGAPIRDVLADSLRAHKGRVSGKDAGMFDPAHRRMALPMRRPVRCKRKGDKDDTGDAGDSGDQGSK